MHPLLSTRPIFTLLLGTLLLVPHLGAASAEPPPQPAVHQLALPAVDDGLPGKGPLRRHIWFQKLWIERRAAWVQQIDQDQGALVFFGDSITQGWGDDFGGAFPGTKTANRGISGDTTRGLLLRLEQDVLALNPAGIVLLIGTNDIEEAARIDAIVHNVELLVDRIAAHDPTLPILLCETFPSSPTKDRGPELIGELNAGYHAAFAGNPQVTLVATWAPFAGPDGNARVENMPDLLHPNAAGYLIWRDALVPVLSAHNLLTESVRP